MPAGALSAPRGYGPTAAFCPRCATALADAPPVRCLACGYQLFVNARPTANAVVVDGDRFLALRRAVAPRAGRWETPGGFCDGREHPAETAVRECREELGVEITLGPLIGMYLGDYDFQGETLPVLDCFFLAGIDRGEPTVNPAEASDLRWFSLREPPPLAFDTMDAALRDVLPLLRP